MLLTNGLGYTWIKSCPGCETVNICTGTAYRDNKVFNVYRCLKCDKKYGQPRKSTNELIALTRVESKKTGKRYEGVRCGANFVVEKGDKLSLVPAGSVVEVKGFRYQVKRDGVVMAAMDEPDSTFKDIAKSGTHTIWHEGKNVTKKFGRVSS